jgi:hypothetical protein
MLWLASDKYSVAPQKEDGKVNLGTESRITAEWTSPWIGYSIEDVAKWLQEKPDSVDLDGNHFAVLSKEAVDKTVVLCKIGDQLLKGDSLSFQRISARMASVRLGGMDASEWEGI